MYFVHFADENWYTMNQINQVPLEPTGGNNATKLPDWAELRERIVAMCQNHTVPQIFQQLKQEGFHIEYIFATHLQLCSILIRS